MTCRPVSHAALSHVRTSVHIDLSSVKQNPVVKKEKGPIKIQDMPTFISDLRGFVNSMKEIKLKGWHAKATVLPTIGSSIELPVWTK